MDPKDTLEQLNKTIQWCRNATFYRNRLPYGQLRSQEDFQRIPLLTKEDLRKNSPFGMICVPSTELYQYHESFGTTGTPVSVWLTQEDYQINAAELATWGVAFHPGDIVMVRFPYSISAIAHTVTTAAQLHGACVVPAGARSKVSPFPRVVNLLRKLKVTVLACLPLQTLLIAETAELLGLDPGKDFPSLRAICTAGETLSPGRRKTIERIWNCPVYDNYGMTEIGAAVVDCAYQRSHPLEEYFYFEVMQKDLVTPAQPGETGYLVITTLKRRGMPLVRYLTGDLARLLPVNCSCGLKTAIEIRGRAENVIRVNKRQMDLWEIQELIAELPCRRFWVVAPGKNKLNVIVEEETGSETIPGELLETLGKKYGIQLSVSLLPKGTLYNRNELLSVGEVGKPQYIYTPQEIADLRHFNSLRV